MNRSNYISAASDHNLWSNDDRIERENLRKLKAEIKNFCARNNSDPGVFAYEKARAQNKLFVESSRFTIGFLRAECFDVQRAARRLLKYFEEKLDLFGLDKLTRDILLSDLGNDAMAYFERGNLQPLPKRNKKGQLVVFEIGGDDAGGIDRHLLSVRKAYFYFFGTLGEDDSEEDMSKGIAVISWRVHKRPLLETSCFNAISKIWQSAPIRISAYHFCIDSTQVSKSTLNWGYNFPGIVHRGKSIDCMYSLSKESGCPVEWFPLNCESPEHGLSTLAREPDDSNNNQGYENPYIKSSILTYYVKSWLRRRENIDNEKELLIIPDFIPDSKLRQQDILLGKGKPLQKHPGNIWFRELIASKIKDYNTLDKTQKTKFSEKICQDIKEQGRKFLKKKYKGFWEEISNLDARGKVSFTLRTERRNMIQRASNDNHHGPDHLGEGDNKPRGHKPEPNDPERGDPESGELVPEPDEPRGARGNDRSEPGGVGTSSVDQGASNFSGEVESLTHDLLNKKRPIASDPDTSSKKPKTSDSPLMRRQVEESKLNDIEFSLSQRLDRTNGMIYSLTQQMEMEDFDSLDINDDDELALAAQISANAIGFDHSRTRRSNTSISRSSRPSTAVKTYRILEKRARLSPDSVPSLPKSDDSPDSIVNSV